MRKKRLAQNKDDLHDLGPDDLLSRFTDDILVSILSYLPLKDAAATSKLSRRWRYLWCQIVRLHFEDKERSNKIRLVRCATLKKYMDLVFTERNKYINWVNRIICQHKRPNIDEFKICFNLDKNAKGAIGKWIEFAISKNVQTLELNLQDGLGFCNREIYAFPKKIFDKKCKSSSKRSSFDVRVKTVMEIKFLKTLIMKRVDVNDECLKKILSNCPVLEHLSINFSCSLVKAQFHGKGLALKNLEIIYCDRLESIEICDSNIVSVNCKGPFRQRLPITLRLNNLPKLEKFFIHNDYPWKKVNDMFCQISSCMPYLQVLELDLSLPQRDIELLPYPELPKLKQLVVKVDVRHDSGLVVLTSLVEACPNLQRFTVQLIWPIYAIPEKTNREVRQVAKQPHQHLEVVEIGGYRGWTSDLELAMYFIENGVALKKLVIKPFTELRLAANEIMQDKSAARYHARQELEPRTPVGVELVIL